MKAVELESERLIYRPLSLNHLSLTYVGWMNDFDVYKYLESGGNYSFKELKTYLKTQEEKDILFWAIHIKETNKHIGNIKIDPINELDNSGEYGIMMGDKTEWGKGYAKETSLKIIQFCFEKLNLDLITLGVIEKNKKAVKLYKSIGFNIEKVIVNQGIYNGEVCNSIRMVKRND